MLIGLVTEQSSNTRKNWLKRLFRITTYKRIQSPKNEFDILVAELSYSLKELDKKTPQRLERLIQKNILVLEKQTAGTILSDNLKELCQSKRILSEKTDNPKAKMLFLKLSPVCIRQTSKLCGIRLIDAVFCIRDTKMDRISEYLLKELCYDVNNIVICTKNQAGAKAVCEKFYDETGLLVRISDTDAGADIMVDADNAVLRFGRDLYVRSADLGYEFQDFGVNQLEVAQIMNKKAFGKIKWKYSYE